MKFELHLLSNGKMALDRYAELTVLLHPWLSAIHLREKLRHAKEIYECVTRMIESGVEPTKIIINDRADIACAAGAGGVQVPWHGMPVERIKLTFPQLRIGCSVHSLEEGKVAEQQGADYVLYGHVFATNSKPGLAERGLAGLQQIVEGLTIPVIAIGGIQPEHLPRLQAIGAGGAAIMSGILDAEQPEQALQKYMQAMEWKSK